MLERRKFLKNGLWGTAAILPLSIPAFTNVTSDKQYLPGNPFKLMYAFHDGMFKNSGG